jgi:hypothetical protein
MALSEIEVMILIIFFICIIIDFCTCCFKSCMEESDDPRKSTDHKNVQGT